MWETFPCTFYIGEREAGGDLLSASALRGSRESQPQMKNGEHHFVSHLNQRPNNIKIVAMHSNAIQHAENL